MPLSPAPTPPSWPVFPSLPAMMGWVCLAVLGPLACAPRSASDAAAAAGAAPPALSSASSPSPASSVVEGPLAAGVLIVEFRAGEPHADWLPSSDSRSASPSAATVPVHPDAPLSLGDVPLRPLRRLNDPVPWDRESGDIWLLQLADPRMGQTVGSTLAALSRVARDRRVRRVEPDRIRHASADAGVADGGTPGNGPGRRANDRFVAQQWSLPMVRAFEAWNLSGGSEDVVVAILDTGILPGHPDLAGRLLPGYDFVSNPESADDGDTRRDADPTDTGTIDSSRLHGTHVAGIIGAATGNRIGIAGIDQRCRLLPVRVLGVRNGDGLDSDISDAIRWSAGIPIGNLPPPVRPADVLNLSFGGPVVSFTLQRAVQQAIARGSLVVVAAGNGGDDARTYSPGGLDDVISVGAVGRDGKRAPYSNFGPRVDLLAPGGSADLMGDEDAGFTVEGILSTYRDDGLREDPKDDYSYGVLSGTSQAAPHVSAAAAMARALAPNLRQPGLATLLAATANRRYRCDSDPQQGCGAGLLDIASLLSVAQRQPACGCAEGQICLNDGICRQPSRLHDPLVPDNRLRGGFCQLSAGVGPASQSASTQSLLALWAACLLLLLCRRFSAWAGSFPRVSAPRVSDRSAAGVDPAAVFVNKASP